jgi:drug/metabolite transporter (DMT)-like permease
MLLYNTGPLFSPLLARMALGITFGARTVVSLILGFAGVMFVLNPFGERLDGSVFIALASGFFNACSQLAFHQMSRSESDPLRSLFPFYALLTLCSAAALPFSWGQTVTAFKRLAEWHVLVVIAGLGVVGVLNQSTKAVAYRNVRNPANLGPFLYLSLIAAAIFDWLLYGVVPNAETLLGGVLILSSAFTILWGTLFRRRVSNS